MAIVGTISPKLHTSQISNLPSRLEGSASSHMTGQLEVRTMPEPLYTYTQPQYLATPNSAITKPADREPWSPSSQAGPSSHRDGPNGRSSVSLPGTNGNTSTPNGKLVDDDGDGRAGVEDPCGDRQYTELKCLGDGSFGTVWLCDWHSPVKQDVLLSAMQCGAGAREEWAGKRLVALKRMKKVWDGGWSQAKNLGELVSLRRIPPHPAVIPLYDAFISPTSRELYFVFECMEGNLYQLTKSRKGRPLAAGLIASCFHQISAGLCHIHQHGYFHRDMKPENLLVTTTGLTDYLTAATLNAINDARREGREEASAMPRTPNGDAAQRFEKDVMVIVKLADFGLARETSSKPPYTEYVSTRWYRAPEVLLRSTEYGPPTDMWALGTILAEMLNLKPLFPGVSEIDQVWRICDTLGDPSAEYGQDDRGMQIGGGPWNTGIKLAKKVGFSFPKRAPVNFRGLFNESVPQSLVDCIADLLRYNPRYRLTSAQCMDHPYFHETLPHLQRTPPLPRIPFSQGQPAASAIRQQHSELTAPPRQVPPSHSHSHQDTRPAFANGDMRSLPPPVGTPDGVPNGRLFPYHASDGRAYGTSALVNQLRELDLPTDDLASYGHRPPGEIPQNGVAAWAAQAGMHNRHPSSNYESSTFDGSQNDSTASFPGYSNLSVQNLHIADNAQRNGPQSHVAAYIQQQQQMSMYDTSTPRQAPVDNLPMPPPIEPTHGAARPPPVPSPASLAKKKKWGLSSVFGSSEKHLPVVDETGSFSAGGASLKRTQSGNHPDTRLQPMTPAVIDDPKKAKKEEQRLARELEKAKREAAERAQKERARAVMRKREQLVEARQAGKIRSEVEFGGGSINNPAPAVTKHSYVQPPVAEAFRQSHGNASMVSVRPPQPQPVQQSGGYAPQMPGASSLASIRSQESHQSGLSARALAERDRLEELTAPPVIGRHKARRRDEDDDHSMSSFDVNSLRSRSVLTVGTIDSDPGPRRQQWNDPADPANRRHASHSGFPKSHSKSRLMSGSNPSLDSQLAHDFTKRANLASGSSTSLGRHAASNLSLHDLPPPHPDFNQTPPGGGQGSAPISPYGHPKGAAVAYGVGMGRAGQTLPSISDWQGEETSKMINPMFRVAPAQGQHALPPFSAIAEVADRQHQNGQQPPSH